MGNLITSPENEYVRSMIDMDLIDLEKILRNFMNEPLTAQQLLQIDWPSFRFALRCLETNFSYSFNIRYGQRAINYINAHHSVINTLKQSLKLSDVKQFIEFKNISAKSAMIYNIGLDAQIRIRNFIYSPSTISLQELQEAYIILKVFNMYDPTLERMLEDFLPEGTGIFWDDSDRFGWKIKVDGIYTGKDIDDQFF